MVPFLVTDADARGLVFRNSSYTDLLVEQLKASGRADDGALVQATCDAFAQRRWGSLARWCRALLQRRSALEEGWRADLFRVEGSDALAAAKMAAGRGEDAALFLARVGSAEAVLGVLEDLRSRAGRCDRHEQARRVGQRVTCVVAGRRGKGAWPRAQLAQRDVEALATQAPIAYAACVVGALCACVRRAVVAARARVSIRFAYLDEAPCLLARARSHAAAAKLLSDHDAVSGSGRPVHRATARFCDLASPLRACLERVASGQRVDEVLARELQPYEWTLLGESAIEGEHRALRVESQRSHAVRHPFAAPIVRAPQNAALAVAARALPDGSRAVVSAWSRIKLLATPRARPRPVRFVAAHTRSRWRASQLGFIAWARRRGKARQT